MICAPQYGILGPQSKYVGSSFFERCQRSELTPGFGQPRRNPRSQKMNSLDHHLPMCCSHSEFFLSLLCSISNSYFLRGRLRPVFNAEQVSWPYVLHVICSFLDAPLGRDGAPGERSGSRGNKAGGTPASPRRTRSHTEAMTLAPENYPHQALPTAD